MNDTKTMADMIEQQIKTIISASVDNQIQAMIASTIDNLVLDKTWLEKIENLVVREMSSRVIDQISAVDVESVIANTVHHSADRWRHELTKQFCSTGIQDIATQCELVVSDGKVVARSGLACTSLQVEQDLTVRNLVLTGTVNTDCVSWNELAETVAARAQDLLDQTWQRQLTQQVLDLAREQGIDFQSVRIDGEPLVQDNTLSANITDSTLQSVGILRELRVDGRAAINNSLAVVNGRVGVNTENPEMALSVWDEEVSLNLGKSSKNRAWIGTARNQALEIGVNRKTAVLIEEDGLVSVNRLRLDRWCVTFGNSVPNHSGTRGDLVINHDPKPDAPFAWQCLGGLKWQPIQIN